MMPLDIQLRHQQHTHVKYFMRLEICECFQILHVHINIETDMSDAKRFCTDI